MKIFRFPIYPILIIVYFYLLFYVTNSTSLLFPTQTMLSYLAISIVVVSVVWGSLYVWWKDVAKAGILVAAIVFLFFTYGHMYDTIFFRKEPIRVYVSSEVLLFRSHAALMGAYALLLIAAVMLTVARGHQAYRLTSTLNFMSVVLCCLPLITLLYQSDMISKDNNKVEANSYFQPQVIPLNSSAKGYGDTLPDIYYIILDGYARADILQEYYNYDNTFVDFLEARDFYVADESTSNYTVTLNSLSSSLNMQFLEDVPPGTKDSFFQKMIQDSTLCRTLQEIGYQFIMTETIITGVSKCADMRIPNSVNNLDVIFLKTTLVRPLLNQAIWGRPTYEHHLANIDILKDIPDREEPTFTFAHFILPHEPFVFDREGNQIYELPMYGTPEYDQGYLNQLIYTNVLIEEVVDTILEKSDIPPIIVIQADHGTAWGWNETDMSVFVKTRLPILNAYHLPYGGTEAIYPSISPVNSFRVILNYYFGTDLELLEDEAYLLQHEEGVFMQLPRP